MPLNKKALRTQYNHVRLAAMSTLNGLLVDEVLTYLEQRNSANDKLAIGITWPLAGEPDLRALAERQPAPLALPATAANYSISYHLWRDAPRDRNFAVMLFNPSSSVGSRVKAGPVVALVDSSTGHRSKRNAPGLWRRLL